MELEGVIVMRKKMSKTRNIALFTAMGMVVIYTIANCVFGWLNTQNGMVFQFDATQTSEWFEFWKWVVITGGSITVAKTVKGKTNSDKDEGEVI